ncbi:MAG: hypothetical protein ACYDHP_08955 [Ferrimicrobium sp.]
MTEVGVESVPIRARATIAYLGPTAPHWEIRWVSGEHSIIDEFAQRVYARLLMLPPHDPQFRRNRERVTLDAEREGIACTWDIDEDYDEAL